jgi:hypothetical protein
MFESILIMKNQKYRNMQNRNFSAGPVVKTSLPRVTGSILGQGTKISHAKSPKKKTK